MGGKKMTERWRERREKYLQKSFDSQFDKNGNRINILYSARSAIKAKI